MIRKNLGLISGALAFLILILDSRSAAQAAAEGVQACIRTVIPCLFPFFLLAGYLTSALSGGKAVAGIFRCSGNCASILITGLLGGYPVGAKQASEGYHAGILTKEQADRLLWFCSQAGPSFLFGIAAAQAGGIRSGWVLWGIQILSTFSVARILPGESETDHKVKPANSGKINLMASALTAMASVCGWVIVFSVVISFAKRWFLWLLPESIQVLFCGLLELTNGCLLLGEISDASLRLLLAAVMLNFGGICVLMQTVSLTKGLNIRGYLKGKLLQTGFAVLYTLVITGHLLWLIPIIFIIFLKNFKNRTCIFTKAGI